MRDSVVIAAISDLVLQILDADQPSEFAVPVAPLTDGRILLGREFLSQRTAPSRIVFVPVGGSLGPPNVKSNTSSQGFNRRILQRPLGTDLATYEVYCWGQANPADPGGVDFDATRYLAHVVIQATQLLAMSSAHVGGETLWTDQDTRSPQRLKAGHELMFRLSIEMPILDSGVQFPPSTLTTVPTVAITNGS